MENIYQPLNLIQTPILFTDLKSAELIKYASNAFLAMKISLLIKWQIYVKAKY